MPPDFPSNARDIFLLGGDRINRNVKDLGNWFDRVPVLAAIGDATHLRYVNEGWTRFLGWSKEEILALQWTSIIHPHDMDQTVEACVVERLPLINYPNRYLMRNGGYLWIRWYMEFPSDTGFFYSCGIPVLEASEEFERISDFRSQVFHRKGGQ